MSDGDKVIKVPIRSLEEYRFRFDFERHSHIGQGDGDSQVGDVIGGRPSGNGAGDRAGDEPGMDYYEAGITVDELARTTSSRTRAAVTWSGNPKHRWTRTDTVRDVRRHGIMANIDRRRTLIRRYNAR